MPDLKSGENMAYALEVPYPQVHLIRRLKHFGAPKDFIQLVDKEFSKISPHTGGFFSEVLGCQIPKKWDYEGE